ncbi:MAG: helix-hairpin-helix domain-containing protein [Flavobacteriales bacterium]
MDRKTLSGGSVLLFLNLLFALGFFLYERYIESQPPLDPAFKSFRKRDGEGKGGGEGYRPDSLFPFDPNELSLEGWKKLGLSSEQARVILNYRKSGGTFGEAADLRNIYSLRKEHIEAWKGYMRFPERQEESHPQEEGVPSIEDSTKRNARKSSELFPFDPNRISVKEWERLGLSPEQAATVSEYRKAGGKFWEADDLLKLYVVDTALYRRWKPYVRIDKEALKIPIDRADTSLLKALKGIGGYRAQQIVAYRKLLGGYVRKEQLKEVYGLPDSILAPLMERVKLTGGAPDRIPLDTSAKGLMQHPYIDPGTAEAIVDHRKRYGAFERKSELRSLDLLSAEEYRKIAPYLELSAHEQ